MGNNARLGRRAPVLVNQDPLHGYARFPQDRPQLLGLGIAAHHAPEEGRAAQADDVRGGVGRTAGLTTPPAHFDDGDRGFRRDAPHGSPKVFVEHHVAEDEHPLAGKRRDDLE